MKFMSSDLNISLGASSSYARQQPEYCDAYRYAVQAKNASNALMKGAQDTEIIRVLEVQTVVKAISPPSKKASVLLSSVET